jgi:hypothetical protein
MKRASIPVLMLAACVLILGCYRLLTPSNPGPAATPTPALTSLPEPAVNPSPTTPSTSTSVAQSSIPPTGEQAPDFTLPSGTGGTIALSGYKGQKNVVLLFYRTGG